MDRPDKPGDDECWKVRLLQKLRICEPIFLVGFFLQFNCRFVYGEVAALMRSPLSQKGGVQMPPMHKRREMNLASVTIAVAISILSTATLAKGVEKTLYKFNGSDGAAARAGLTAGSSGDLFGTTYSGGSGRCQSGCGVIFEVTPRGRERVLHRFSGGSDGARPYGGLLIDGTGNLYGTTTLGGDTNCQSPVGCGVVFKLAPDGTETVLYAFQGGSDGWGPGGALAMDDNGNLFGATGNGGSYNGSNCDIDGCGTVFEVEPDGTKVTLHTFQSGNDGSQPLGGVILDSSGNLYGTTSEGGGSGCDGYGCGTVFKVGSGGMETVLYAFQGESDGTGLYSGVIMDSAGNLYGTTAGGGNCTYKLYVNNCGTIYKLASDGTKAVLYNFQGGDDGLVPWAPLVMDMSANLYGTTFEGGGLGCGFKRYGTGCGTVFKLEPDGSETVLYSFRSSYGKNPEAGLLLGPNNELYGTTTRGGMNNNGVVFELKN